MTPDYCAANRRAWDELACRGYPSTVPYGAPRLARARELLDPGGWITWNEIRTVLCLGAGGGQQVPLVASLGCRVTAVDLSPEQVDRDRVVCEQFGFDVELIEGDMLDLAALHGRGFDLVYQALSAYYLPDVRALYAEVASVLRPGGYYRVEHANPVTLQLPEFDAWDGSGYRLVRPQTARDPIDWPLPESGPAESIVACRHYLHSLDDLIGGLGYAGFVVLRFAERAAADLGAAPGTYAHLAAYVPPFFTILARRAGVA